MRNMALTFTSQVRKPFEGAISSGNSNENLIDLPFLLAPIVNRRHVEPKHTILLYLQPTWHNLKYAKKAKWYELEPLNHSDIYDIDPNSKFQDLPDHRGVFIKNNYLLENLVTSLYEEIEKLIDLNKFVNPKGYSQTSPVPEIVEIETYVVSQVFRADSKRMKETHITQLKILSRLKKDLEKRLPVAIKYKFVTNSRPLTRTSIKSFYPSLFFQNKNFECPHFKIEVAKTCLMLLHPNHLEFTNENYESFSGFGVFETEQIGFLGNLNLESTRATFWENIMGNGTKLFIMNTSDEKLSKFLLEKIDTKPKDLRIIWFFFNQKTLRQTLRKITKFRPRI